MNTIIKGRIAGNIEINVIGEQKQVANIRIAENKAYVDKKSGQKRRITNWYNVEVWNGVAEALQSNARKGDLVKFKVNVQPNSYHSVKYDRTVNELVYTANRFKVVRPARETDQPIPKPTEPLNN